MNGRPIDRMKYGLHRFRLRLSDRFDMWASRSLNIENVSTVCLALGPYRNLTTLTASMLFMHKDCQVLNHAADRIYGRQEIDFLHDYHKAKMDRFIQFAIKISEKGQRGDWGGSITYSHAFDDKQAVYERVRSQTKKTNVRCLFWKESLRTSNVIRERRVDLARIFETEARLRFLLPIRNPMDCAVSNLKTRHVRLFRDLNPSPSLFEVVQAVVDEIIWFAELKEQFPKRFFYFTEHDISRAMLTSLASHLQLDADEAWISDALIAMSVRSGYEHKDSVRRFYRDYVTERAGRFPELSKDLLAFGQG